MNKIFSVLLLALAAIALLVACGDDSHSSSFDCCLNGAYYDCANEDEFATCNLADGASECTRDSSRDDECE